MNHFLIKYYLILLISFSQFTYSQEHFDLSTGMTFGVGRINELRAAEYYGGGSINELRAAKYFKPKRAISVSGVLYYNGIDLEIFPRLGILNLLNSKGKNYNILTYGVQLTGIRFDKELSKEYERELLEFSPYINFRTPIFRLGRDCKCKLYKGLILEIVIDSNLFESYVGFGIRRAY